MYSVTNVKCSLNKLCCYNCASKSTFLSLAGYIYVHCKHVNRTTSIVYNIVIVMTHFIYSHLSGHLTCTLRSTYRGIHCVNIFFLRRCVLDLSEIHQNQKKLPSYLKLDYISMHFFIFSNLIIQLFTP